MNNSSYYWISMLANFCQLADFQMNVQQLTNDDLMEHLLEQDGTLDYQNKILQEQTNDYLEKIVEQNKEIISLLKGGSLMHEYSKVDNEMENFKEYVHRTTDLLCDSYKWKKLSRHTENREAKEKYEHISTMLYDMFMNEYNSMIAKYKED